MPAYGRGGAGNIQAVAVETARITEDVEANGTTEHFSGSPSTIGLRNGDQQYVHGGRGGAGNLHNATDLKHVQVPEEMMAGNAPASQSPSNKVPGRGGAGNYEFAMFSKNQQDALDAASKEATRRQIEQETETNINNLLTLPTKARIANSLKQKP